MATDLIAFPTDFSKLSRMCLRSGMLPLSRWNSHWQGNAMITREAREKELQEMIRTTTGRAEILRLAQEIRGTSAKINMGGLFIGQMIVDILAAEYPAEVQ